MVASCGLRHFRDWHIEQQVAALLLFNAGLSDNLIYVVQTFWPALAMVIGPSETQGVDLDGSFLSKVTVLCRLSFITEVSVVVMRLSRVFRTPIYVNAWPDLCMKVFQFRLKVGYFV
jgi:hypothetical protein